MRSVLSMASFAKGGITEWLEMDIVDFVDWVKIAMEMVK